MSTFLEGTGSHALQGYTVTSGHILSKTREGTALAQLYSWQPSLQELTLVLENATIAPRVYSVIKLLFRYSQLSMTVVQWLLQAGLTWQT